MTESYKIPGIFCINHRFQVPLDHDKPGSPTITVFIRELRSLKHQNADRPYLIFFQGGPGFPALRPNGLLPWVNRALEEFHVILMDYRGTGLSTPIDLEHLQAISTDPQNQADYLSLFRADSIVRDAELIRRQMLGDKRWSVLGQSFGGFCTMTYLSFYPDGIAEAFVTGGLPPLDGIADDVYRATYSRLKKKNQLYFDRYPADKELCQKIAECIESGTVHLPDHQKLTVRCFQQLGITLGYDGGFEDIHFLIEEAFPHHDRQDLSYSFLYRLMQRRSMFETNPIYSFLHEPIYNQGSASNWSAHRLLEEYPEFVYSKGQPLFFTGEMIYPWMFEEYPRLTPLQKASEILATKVNWPKLYDPAILSQNSVACAALVYENDIFVERELSLATVDRTRGMKVWVTNEYEHDGLRKDGYRILDRLITMARN